MKCLVYKRNGSLWPANDDAEEAFSRLPNNDAFLVSYIRVRNPRHHNKYFAFIGEVYKNIPEEIDYVRHPKSGLIVKRWPTKRNFRKQMEMYAGHYEETITMKGDLRLEPKSIRYAELGEDKFSELHTGVKNVIGRIILPKMDMDVVEKAIESFY